LLTGYLPDKTTMQKTLHRNFSNFLALFLLFAGISTKAQLVTLPDTVFRNWLMSNGYQQCFTNNQLDVSCSAVTSATSINCSGANIQNLNGVQYFTHLDTLICSYNYPLVAPYWPANLKYLDCTSDGITALAALPSTLLTLYCSANPVVTLGTLPAGLQTLACSDCAISTISSLPASLLSIACSGNTLASLPALPAGLQYLDCSNNVITSLPALPSTLQNLICFNNSLSALPALPAALQQLDCYNNTLTSLPVLPQALSVLACYNNQITVMPALPASMVNLACSANKLTVLPALNAGLQYLYCDSNLLTALPALPQSLWELSCANNQITAVPPLPYGLHVLICTENNLGSLPQLPETMTELDCGSNHLTVLPALPDSVSWLTCEQNLLTSLPELPDYLSKLDCHNNYNLSCLPELKYVYTLLFDSTAVTCMPDYGSIGSSFPDADTLPKCSDTTANGCGYYGNIVGHVALDTAAGCGFKHYFPRLNNIKTMLYANGQLVQQAYTDSTGNFSLSDSATGNFRLTVDTSQLPFTMGCPDSDAYIFTNIQQAPFFYGFNFMFKCPGTDLGVWSIVNNQVVPRPGATVQVNMNAGDMSQLYNAGCAAGVSGQLQVTLSGPVSYAGPAAGALTPTVNGQTLTWAVSDFGSVNNSSSFNILVKIDTTATAGQAVCINASVTTPGPDVNAGNNQLSYCFAVVNSADPNGKEVYPADTVQEWMTYTVRFQNTGNAAAVNVIILDTLDTHFNPASFQLLAYSAPVQAQVISTNVISFAFKNINLPDSSANADASHGYVQYKVKPFDNPAIGSQIYNTASIYFDYNAPVVTNTTLNTVTSAITAIAPFQKGGAGIKLYPNPAKNSVTLQGENISGGKLSIYDITGREVMALSISSTTFRIPAGQLPSGLYLLRVLDNQNLTTTQKLVIEK
jgi:uncharacterized repeat protein (TIGR01451 family)